MPPRRSLKANKNPARSDMSFSGNRLNAPTRGAEIRNLYLNGPSSGQSVRPEGEPQVDRVLRQGRRYIGSLRLGPPGVSRAYRRLASRFEPQKLFRKNGITSALVRSMKKAETNGTMMKARCEAPKRWVTAAMFAIAVGVEPRVTPPKPAATTAAS